MESCVESKVAFISYFPNSFSPISSQLPGSLTLQGTLYPLPILKSPIIRICEKTKKSLTSDFIHDLKSSFSQILNF